MKSFIFSFSVLCCSFAMAEEYIPAAPVPMTAPQACRGVQAMPTLAPSVCSPAAATPMYMPAPPVCSQAQSLITQSFATTAVIKVRRHPVEEVACALGQRIKEHRAERKERRATRAACVTTTATTGCSACGQAQVMAAPAPQVCAPVMAAPSPCPSCH